MLTTVAYYESVDNAAAYEFISAAADPHVFVNGNDIRIPDLTQLVAIATRLPSGGQGNARLASPSLRNISRLIIEPVNGGADADTEPGSPQVVTDRRTNPIVLVKGESLTCEHHADPGAARVQWTVLWLADGPITPVQGAITTVRATSATTLVAGAWTACALTFDEALPVGRYAVVGMRARSAGAIAARLVFIGYQWRPGVLAVDAVTDLQHEMFRSGRMGLFGEFENENPPQVEFLALSADTAEVVELDIIKVG